MQCVVNKLLTNCSDTPLTLRPKPEIKKLRVSIDRFHSQPF